MGNGNYSFQRVMREKMQADGLSQHEVARQVSAIVGRTIYARTINLMLKPVPSIPQADTLVAVAKVMDAEPLMFIASAYASRQSDNELTGMSEFVRQEFEKADEDTKRRIIELLRKGT